MDYQTLLSSLANKGTRSFWYALAQSAWVQCGGGKNQSHKFAHAFTLGAMAASILDDVQDQDGSGGLFQTLGNARAGNIGVALAFRVMDVIGTLDLAPEQENRLMKHYVRTVGQMCQGQHNDLGSHDTFPNLNDAWVIVEDKTAAWCAFGVSAYAEAIGDERARTLEIVGRHIGCWHQIGNDLTSILEDDGKGDLLYRKHTVLSAYAFSVAEGSSRQALESAWHTTGVPESVAQLRELFLELGADHYAAVMGNYHLTEANRLAKAESVNLPVPCAAPDIAYKWAPTDEAARL